MCEPKALAAIAAQTHWLVVDNNKQNQRFNFCMHQKPTSIFKVCNLIISTNKQREVEREESRHLWAQLQRKKRTQKSQKNGQQVEGRENYVFNVQNANFQIP